MAKHYVGEVGTDLILDTGIQVGTVAFNFIKWKDPGGLTGSFSSAVYSSYSQLAKANGTYLLKYTLDSGDFSSAGEWEFQAYVGAADGTWYGETVKLDVMNEFE